MPTNIFINYRKDDSKWPTQALYNELLKYFSKELIFKDSITIEPGEDFDLSINNALAKCDVLIVIIGKNWLGAKNENGLVRLEDPKDFVRIEIATALKRNIRVIPVLLDGIELPRENNLPEDLQLLTRRQFVTISDSKFETDVQTLAGAVKKIIEINQPTHQSIAENKSSRPRSLSALILGLAGAILSSLTSLVIYSHDSRFTQQFASQQGFSLIKAMEISAVIGGVLWAILGAIAGRKKIFLTTGIISSSIVLSIWIAVAGTESDVMTAAINFGMPFGGMIGMFFLWLIQKLQISGSEN